MTIALATIFVLAFVLAFARMIVCREPKPRPYQVSRQSHAVTGRYYAAF